MFAGITVFGQVSAEQIEKNSKAITEQINQKISLTEDQQTLVYRQVYTYQANMMKFSTVNDMNDKMMEAKENMESNYFNSVKDIVGEENYAEIKDIVEKKK
jgi:hypothetical protein